jgi:hypothetical protein
MIVIDEFEPDFCQAFPQLCDIFRRAPLTVHEGVSKVTLHGLRGAPGEIQDNSELDLRLLVDCEQYPDIRHDEELLKEIVYTTLAPWREKIKLDLSVIFDTRQCQLKCYDQSIYTPTVCTGGGFDCFGMFKIQENEPLFVQNFGSIRYIYPCITVWKNPRTHRYS